MEDPLTQPTPEPQGDLLEQLLVVAAEKAAKREADEALRKGFVTREQINSALSQFGDSLEDRLTTKVAAALSDQVAHAVQNTLDKTPGLRKSTVLTPEQEREDNPVAYLLKKGREAGPESFDQVEKDIIWGLTYKVLARGMSDEEEGD